MKNPPFDSLVWGSLRLAPIMMVLHVWGVGWSVKFNMHNISNMSIAFIEQTMPTCSMHNIQHACTKANVLAQHANIHTQYADIHASCKHNMSLFMHNMSYISMYLQYANMHAQSIIVQAQHTNMHSQNANVHTQHADMHTQYNHDVVWTCNMLLCMHARRLCTAQRQMSPQGDFPPLRCWKRLLKLLRSQARLETNIRDRR